MLPNTIRSLTPAAIAIMLICSCGATSGGSDTTPPSASQQSGWTGIDASLIIPIGASGAIDDVTPYTGSDMTLEAHAGIATSPGPDGALQVVVPAGTYVVDVTACPEAIGEGGDYVVTVIQGSHALVTATQRVTMMSALNGYLGVCSPGTGSAVR